MNKEKNVKLDSKIVSYINPINELPKRKRNPAKYIEAAKKNKWIQHVKKIGKKGNVSFKEALKLCKSKK
jgi:hypothetical protein